MVSKPRLLDLFCCAGGAGSGYARAGFEVVGVDIEPQPNYPFEFIQSDALELDPEFVASFDAIHASPPCQMHSVTASINPTAALAHGDFIPQTREMLISSGRPYVIENVPGAPLIDPIMLCGQMFGLRVWRRRLFETSFFLLTPPHHPKRGSTNSSIGYSSFATADLICVAGNNFNREDGAAAMEISWAATRKEIAQAIPPAYTEYIGRSLISSILATPKFTCVIE